MVIFFVFFSFLKVIRATVIICIAGGLFHSASCWCSGQREMLNSASGPPVPLFCPLELSDAVVTNKKLLVLEYSGQLKTIETKSAISSFTAKRKQCGCHSLHCDARRLEVSMDNYEPLCFCVTGFTETFSQPIIST